MQERQQIREGLDDLLSGIRQGLSEIERDVAARDKRKGGAQAKG